LHWIGQHFPQCDEKARNVLSGAADEDGMQSGEFLDRPETHPDYWTAVLLYVVQVIFQLLRFAPHD
jgi:hypothetical protein